jgi:glycosyltransferase involved in cell wall biosynthesis
MLASYFPKPANPLMGNWALSQAQAFLRNGIEVSVVSGTAWVPRSLARAGSGVAAYAACPPGYRWGELNVLYPRWLFYPVEFVRPLLTANPAAVLSPTWWSVKSNLLKAIDRIRPEVIYAHHTQINGYLAWRIHRITDLPYVITDHDFGEIESCRQHPSRRRFFAPIMEGASRMVAVASRMERLMTELFPKSRTLTVHNGSDPPAQAALMKPRPPELASQRILFCACAFYERKGIPLLVRAFARIAAAFPDAILRIAGDGETRPKVEKAMRDTGMSSRIHLLGRLPHDEVLQEMIWADAFVLPGWNEPFATAFTEALSAGCPIVYASDGGITDVAINGTHGLAVEPRSEESLASALKTLLADETGRRTMGKAARELFTKHLLWDHNAIRMRSVFAAAVNSSGSSPALEEDRAGTRA